MNGLGGSSAPDYFWPAPMLVIKFPPSAEGVDGGAMKVRFWVGAAYERPRMRRHQVVADEVGVIFTVPRATNVW